MVASDLTPLLEMQGIEKSFPGVRALRGVDLRLHKGEVHALLGENGAGKSTMMKVLGGVYTPDAGTIAINGRPYSMQSPTDAQRAGVAVIYQEFNLIPALSASENIFLGRETATTGFIHRRDEQRRAAELFQQMGIDIDPKAICKDLTVAQQQVVEIAKALSCDAQILVMDEPTAALSNKEVDKLFATIRDLKAKGIGMVFIGHRLDEIFEIADRVTVLRDGEFVGCCDIADVSRPQMIEMMVGRTLEQEFPKRTPNVGAVRLEVNGFRRLPRVKDVSFQLRRGEILGVAGLVGAGRTETARLIFGADRPEAGRVMLDGKPLAVRSPRDAITNGICLLTEDRKQQGLVLGHSVQDNFGLPNFVSLANHGWVNHRAETDAFAKYVQSLSIKIPHQRQLAKNLSGGNQQKIVLAKWLQRNCDVVIFDEPTRGIDVGAKFEIYLLMNELVEAGKSIIMISSELPEILGMSDRVLVMHEGRVTGEIEDVGSASQEDIMQLAVG